MTYSYDRRVSAKTKHPEVGQKWVIKDPRRSQQPFEIQAAEDEWCNSAARNRSGKFRLTTVDGEKIDLTFREFYAANEYMDPEEAAEIMALQPGETYRGGGGASPKWSIRRLA